jgi:hypothetical protein
MADGSRSSAVTTPAWLRVVMPSVADVFFLALLGVLVLTPLSVRLLGDAGIGWHIRTGQQILAVHSVPRVDSFSSITAGKPWFAWEWLYDVVVGLLEARDDLTSGTHTDAACNFSVDDSFPGASACGQLAVHPGVVLGSRFL